MANYYNIDYNKLAKLLIPPRMRFIVLYAIIKSLIVPINSIYNAFRLYRRDVDYRIRITPQVCYLQKILNDTFDNNQRHIYISNNYNYLVQLIHTDEYQEPLPTYIEGTGNDEEIPIINDVSAYSGTGFDFNVNVPIALTESEEIRMRSILDAYKLAGKKYNINYV